MPRDTRTILSFLKRHGVNKRLRRLIGIAWHQLRNIADAIFALARRRSNFATALLVSILAAVIVSGLPFGEAIGGFIIGAGALLGLAEEFAASFRRSR